MDADAGGERERRGLATAQHVGGRGQGRDGGDPQRVDERRLARPLARHDEIAQPGPARALGHGEHTGGVPQLATERQLAEYGPRVQRGGGDLIAGREHGQGQSGVEPGADLAQERRCKVGRDPRLGKLEARVLDGGAHPIAGFAHGRVAETDDRERGQPRADVDLDPHLTRIDPVDGKGGDPREHALNARRDRVPRGCRRVPILRSQRPPICCKSTQSATHGLHISA